MKRRTVFAKVLVILGALAFALSGSSCERRETLRIYTWTLYLPTSIVRQFESEFGVRVIMDYYTSNEEMLARLMAGGVNFDLAFPSGDFVPILDRLGKLYPIDHAMIPNLANIDPVILEKSADPLIESSVPYFYGAAGIIVNTARVPDFERSWSIFERADIRDAAGNPRMSMLDDMREVMGAALSYLGYSVNTRNPAEIAAARDHIVRHWRPNIVRFDSEAFGIGYSNEDFWVVHGFPELIFAEIAGNERLIRDTSFFIPEGSPAYIDSIVILDGSRSVELAHEFINFVHRPEVYAEFVDMLNFPASVNVPARRYTTVVPMFTVEELYYTELVQDAGPAFAYFDDAWLNTIRIE
ncbi:MAG: extracellular solute-binding protein [Treponema sp.]|nr:extracellular solute-binding protein [Treponema sp.]